MSFANLSGDELMTVAEIAAVLKLNQQTIRNWIYPDFPVMATRDARPQPHRNFRDREFA